MTSIYTEALGSDFGRLHPQIQRRFGFGSVDRTAAIGRGVMERLWHGPSVHAAFPVPGYFPPDHVSRAGMERAVHDRELRLP